MSLARLLTETGTVLRFPTVIDPYGNEVRDLDNPIRTTYAPGTLNGGVRLEQTSGSEVTTDRDAQLADWRLYLHPHADIAGRDVYEDDRGRRFEVVGPPAVQRSPRGPHHLVVRLYTVDG